MKRTRGSGGPALVIAVLSLCSLALICGCKGTSSQYSQADIEKIKQGPADKDHPPAEAIRAMQQAGRNLAPQAPK